MRRELILLALVGCGFPGSETGGVDGSVPDGAPDVTPDVAPTSCEITALRLYGSHTCIVRGGGDTWCWGYNELGEIGLPPTSIGGSTGCNPVPAPVPVEAARWLGMGDNHTCIGATTGTVCWGRNVDFELGAAATDSLAPQVLTRWAGAVMMNGGQAHMCSLSDAGAVKCAGLNSFGELGNGTLSPERAPVPVTLRSPVTRLSGGYNHNCVILDDATVWCWGSNGSGQVAPDRAPHPEPVQVGGIAPADEIGTGVDHSCALGDGMVTCWGDNSVGQLGVGAAGDPAGPVVAQLPLETMQIAIGVRHGCALGIDGQVRCWGEGYTPIPTAVELGMDAVRIAAGSYHDCAVGADGDLYCWHSNNYGQLGNGEQSEPVVTPVRALTCPE